MAVTKEGVIGYKHSMPWRYPSDLKHFKETVAGHVVIMGRKTYEATPKSALESCTKIILTRNTTFQAEGCHVLHSIEEGMLFIKDVAQNGTVYLIGGAEIAKQFLEMDLIDTFLLTIIDRSYPGDTFFDLSLLQDWAQTQLLATEEYKTVLLKRPKFR